MYKIFGHYIPKTLLLLGFTESLVLFISVYIGMSLSIGANSYNHNYPLFLYAGLFCAVMLAAMATMGLYRRDLRASFHSLSLRIVLSLFIGMVVLFIIYVFYPESFLNRNVFLFGVLCPFLGILACRTCWYQQSDKYLKRVMVVGTGEKAQQLEGLRRRTDRFGVEIVGYIDIGDSGQRAVSEDRIVKTINGEPFTYSKFFEQNEVDEIVVGLDERRQYFPADDILEVKMSGIHVVDINTFLERQLGKINLKTLRPSTFIYSDGFTQNPLKAAKKRLLDIIAASFLLVVSSPVMLITALAIWIESRGRGSVIYRQKRLGLSNKIFNVLKFRSMREDAECDGIAKWATKNDDRVTKVGRLIRKTRIDELPQLINVLKGDMSFVGPRPERPEFVNNLSKNIPFYRLRHYTKPGITGWAQICYPYGASLHDAREKLQYDLYYLKHHSIFLDLLILMQTAAVVVSFRGAR